VTAPVPEVSAPVSDVLAAQALSAWHRLVTVNTQIVDPLARAFEASTGMPVVALRALELLDRQRDGVRMAALADGVGLTRGGTSKLVTRLEHQQLAARVTPAGNRRATYAQITHRGRSVLADATPLHRRLVVQHLAPYLDGSDVASITALAKRLG